MTPRFVVADPEVCAALGVPFIVMLGNAGYWIDHIDDLKVWCEQHNSKLVGMTVEIFDAATLTAFMLRWS